MLCYSNKLPASVACNNSGLLLIQTLAASQLKQMCFFYNFLFHHQAVEAAYFNPTAERKGPCDHGMGVKAILTSETGLLTHVFQTIPDIE